MIKRFIRRVFGLPSEAALQVPRENHGLSRDATSPAAAKVCATLREAGFSAYVVGGAVRDLLLGIAPKDFDIATDARPEQIKPLFRRAIIIRSEEHTSELQSPCKLVCRLPLETTNVEHARKHRWH